MAGRKVEIITRKKGDKPSNFAKDVRSRSE